MHLLLLGDLCLILGLKTELVPSGWGHGRVGHLPKLCTVHMQVDKVSATCHLHEEVSLQCETPTAGCPSTEFMVHEARDGGTDLDKLAQVGDLRIPGYLANVRRDSTVQTGFRSELVSTPSRRPSPQGVQGCTGWGCVSGHRPTFRPAARRRAPVLGAMATS